jgi:uncharacterized membrane protein
VRVVRWLLIGAAIVLIGGALGFLTSLLRPRSYAQFASARQP